MKLFKRLFVILFALSAASCAKISYNPTEVSGISLNRSEITMEVSNTFQLEAYNEPSKVSNKNVSWTVSSGSTIVSVSSTGLIRALKTGSAKVTATEKEKGYTATCNITVSKKIIPVTSVSLFARAISLPDITALYVGTRPLIPIKEFNTTSQSPVAA